MYKVNYFGEKIVHVFRVLYFKVVNCDYCEYARYFVVLCCRYSQYCKYFEIFFFFFFILRRMGKNKALAHHTSTYFHTRRVSIWFDIVDTPSTFGVRYFGILKST